MHNPNSANFNDKHHDTPTALWRQVASGSRQQVAIIWPTPTLEQINLAATAENLSAASRRRLKSFCPLQLFSPSELDHIFQRAILLLSLSHFLYLSLFRCYNFLRTGCQSLEICCHLTYIHCVCAWRNSAKFVIFTFPKREGILVVDHIDICMQYAKGNSSSSKSNNILYKSFIEMYEGIKICFNMKGILCC